MLAGKTPLFSVPYFSVTIRLSSIPANSNDAIAPMGIKPISKTRTRSNNSIFFFIIRYSFLSSILSDDRLTAWSSGNAIFGTSFPIIFCFLYWIIYDLLKYLIVHVRAVFIGLNPPRTDPNLSPDRLLTGRYLFQCFASAKGTTWKPLCIRDFMPDTSPQRSIWLLTPPFATEKRLFHLP